jgi:glycosyltransferase involved in cell wall biosynthesis
MSEIINNNKLREDMIAAGKKRAGEFSWERSAVLFLNAIRE